MGVSKPGSSSASGLGGSKDWNLESEGLVACRLESWRQEYRVMSRGRREVGSNRAAG
ncbi:hypothetical protein BofuT4_uP026310.1 [Botrytis cinerea T4]|uniref:Uncharacterized protein n=1 Tax=Botryotinia fuckeliana (strain T4) TaxID=999810 RepID=G2YB42_BOTF4|nr:hypothetical protein BofuT4_uP026310.1 [Botrytis cinerea T4]